MSGAALTCRIASLDDRNVAGYFRGRIMIVGNETPCSLARAAYSQGRLALTEAWNTARWDLRRGVPGRDSSARLVYCEHFLEHLSVEERWSCAAFINR